MRIKMYLKIKKISKLIFNFYKKLLFYLFYYKFLNIRSNIFMIKNNYNMILFYNIIYYIILFIISI